MTNEEKERLTDELRQMLYDPWSSEPKETLIGKLIEDESKIPHYPDCVWVGGDSTVESKKLYKIGTAIIMEDSFKYLGYLPRQILLEDGRCMDSSSGKPFDELLEAVRNGDNVSIDIFKPYYPQLK